MDTQWIAFPNDPMGNARRGTRPIAVTNRPSAPSGQIYINAKIWRCDAVHGTARRGLARLGTAMRGKESAGIPDKVCHYLPGYRPAMFQVEALIRNVIAAPPRNDRSSLFNKSMA